MRANNYSVVIEKGVSGYGAYAPDLPICTAFAKTEPAVRRLITDAIGFHIRGLRNDGDPIPRPRTRS